MPAAGLTEALDIAARSARRDHGVLIAYIFDIAGELATRPPVPRSSTVREIEAVAAGGHDPD